MTQVFYEEDGGFKVGAVLADNDTSLQIEAPHGKRSKIKSAAVMLRFDWNANSGPEYKLRSLERSRTIRQCGPPRSLPN